MSSPTRRRRRPVRRFVISSILFVLSTLAISSFQTRSRRTASPWALGIVATLLMRGRDPGGFFITALLGIVGALLGGFLGRLAGWYGDGNPVGFVMAIIGSLILLAAYRLTMGRTARV